MAEFLFVHGSCHGAWCWQDTIRHMERSGHRARAIDLPGRDAGTTGKSAAGMTLRDHADAILAAISAPVILVGHSAGGYAISLAAELRPDLVTRLVYLAAYVPVAGVSLADRRRAAPEQPLMPAIRIVPGIACFAFDPELAPDLLYHDCPEDVQRAAIARLCPEPIAPQEDTIPALDRWQRIEKHYVRCSGDRAIPPAWQTTMSEGWPEQCRHVLPASHSPFLSMPARLVRLLDAITNQPLSPVSPTA